MKLLITKIPNDAVWYKRFLNTIIDVNIVKHDDIYYEVKYNDCNVFIKKEDCEVIQMKKLNIKKEHNSENLTISHYKDSKYTHISLKSTNGVGNIEIRIGKDYNTTIDQANQILKIMNLPYELVDEIDWSEVKVGTKIKFERMPFDKGDNIGTVYSYAKEFNKVILIYEDELIIKDVRQCEIIV